MGSIFLYKFKLFINHKKYKNGKCYKVAIHWNLNANIDLENEEKALLFKFTETSIFICLKGFFAGLLTLNNIWCKTNITFS